MGLEVSAVADEWRVIARYKPNRAGMVFYALFGPVKGIVNDVADRALIYATQKSPEETGSYARSFEIDHYIETEIGSPRPWPRYAVRLVNTAPHAIIVELGAPRTPQFAILRHTLEYIDKIGATIR